MVSGHLSHDFSLHMFVKVKDEINVSIALSAFRDGDQGPSKVTKTTRLSARGKQLYGE